MPISYCILGLTKAYTWLLVLDPSNIYLTLLKLGKMLDVFR